MSDGYEEPEYEEFVDPDDDDYNGDSNGINNSFSRSCSLQPTLLKKVLKQTFYKNPTFKLS